MPDQLMGKVAYEAYCKNTDNKSLVSGVELPSWESLDERIREAWEASAQAVSDFVYPLPP